LILSDEEVAKILWLKSLKQARLLRYYLMWLKFLPRNVGFQYPDLDLWNTLALKATNLLFNIMIQRLIQAQQWNPIPFAWDIVDILWLDVKNVPYTFAKFSQWEFDNLTIDEKKMIVTTMSLLMNTKSACDKIINHQADKQTFSYLQKVLSPLVQSSIWWPAQILFVKIK
jgi:hypothetical protein